MTSSAKPLLETRFRPSLHGLICGFAMLPDQRIQHLAGDELDAAFARPKTVIWLHFNARVSQARDWIARCERLPEASRRFLLEHDDRGRIEQAQDYLLALSATSATISISTSTPSTSPPCASIWIEIA